MENEDTQKLKELAAEMVEFVIQFVKAGEDIGPPVDADHDDGCADCRMYADAMRWKARFYSGEIERLTGYAGKP